MSLSIFLTFAMHFMGLSAHTPAMTVTHAATASGAATTHRAKMHAYDVGGTLPV
ncbi:MAG TPA: hypothetical protein VIK27_09550 [Candidatus Aquilonibacter sp.]